MRRIVRIAVSVSCTAIVVVSCVLVVVAKTLCSREHDPSVCNTIPIVLIAVIGVVALSIPAIEFITWRTVSAIEQRSNSNTGTTE
jgi:uncharacterized Tic20 family protein